jgi:hypothetical protein
MDTKKKDDWFLELINSDSNYEHEPCPYCSNANWKVYQKKGTPCKKDPNNPPSKEEGKKKEE